MSFSIAMCETFYEDLMKCLFYLSDIIGQLSVQSSHFYTESIDIVVHPSNIQTRLKCTYISYDKDKYFDVQFSVELFIKIVVFRSSFKRNIIQPEFFLLRRIMISLRSG